MSKLIETIGRMPRFDPTEITKAHLAIDDKDPKPVRESTSYVGIIIVYRLVLCLPDQLFTNDQDEKNEIANFSQFRRRLTESVKQFRYSSISLLTKFYGNAGV